MQFKTLKTFDTAIEAYILKNSLEGEGISCVILDENIVTLNPLFNFAVGGIRLQVDSQDFDKAKIIVEEIDKKPNTDDDENIICCPNCKCEDLYSDFKSMKDTKGFIAMVAAFFLTTYPIYSKSVFKCKACDTEFEQK